MFQSRWRPMNNNRRRKKVSTKEIGHHLSEYKALNNNYQNKKLVQRNANQKYYHNIK